MVFDRCVSIYVCVCVHKCNAQLCERMNDAGIGQEIEICVCMCVSFGGRWRREGRVGVRVTQSPPPG